MTRALACLAAALALVCATPAGAYDSATTHAGLTARGALGSNFHRVLATQLGRPLGLFEPLRLVPEHLIGVDGRALVGSLTRLDPGEGYRPAGTPVAGQGPATLSMEATILGWLQAGSVIEQIPAERARHHFLDPRGDRGLDNRAPGRSLGERLKSAFEEGGTFGGIFTGLNFDLSGQASLRWLEDPDNDLGVPRFLAARERAAMAEQPAARATALVQALLAAGAILHVLEDAGEPAHVRNDYRRAFDARVGQSLFDRTARLEHTIALAYGRAGVPPPAGRPFAAARLRDFFVRADGEGLAQRTQRRFFSPGSLPAPVPLAGLASPAEVVTAVNAALPFPEPRIRSLDLVAAARGGAYLTAPGVPALVAYRITPRGLLEFFLDDRTDAAYAQALLPEVGRYAAGALEFLFRGRLAFEAVAPAHPGAATGGGAAILVNRGLALGAGQVTILVDDARGHRRALVTHAVGPSVAPGARLGRVAVPRGSARLTGVFRGQDAAGEPIVVVEETALPLR